MSLYLLQVVDSQLEELGVIFFAKTRRGLYTKGNNIFYVNLSDIARGLPSPYINSIGRRQFYNFVDDF